MSGLYGAVGGVNREIKKLYGSKDGVNREIKKLWGMKDGINRKLFSGAITWQGSCEWSASFYPNVAGSDYRQATFVEPIYINSLTSDIEANTTGSASASAFTKVIYADGSSVLLGQIDTNKLIASILTGVSWGSGTGGEVLFHSYLIVHSREYGDFHLNSSGTSDQ